MCWIWIYCLGTLNNKVTIIHYQTLLTQKLLFLLLQLLAHKISLWMVLNDLCDFYLHRSINHSRKGKPLDKVEYRSHTDKKLCIISCLREYLTRWDKHVGLSTEQLSITLKKSFKNKEPSMKLYDYSFELHQEHVDNCRTWQLSTLAFGTLPFIDPHVLALLTSNSLLSMMIVSLTQVTQLFLSLMQMFLMKLKWIIIKLHVVINPITWFFCS